MAPEIHIAPTSELICYLCILRRTFVAMQAYVQNQDEDGIVLMAWIADTLHNVPSLLWQYDRPWYDTPTEMAAWMIQFPNVVQHCAAPAHLIVSCNHIFSPEGATQELALVEDLSDLALAPPEQMAAHLDLCYDAFIMFRWRQRTDLAWRTRDQDWEQRREGTIEAMGRMAAVLAPVPIGLVHWDQFDQEQFAQQARSLWEEWPSGFGIDRLRSQGLK